jgi:hypothetical protein
MMPNISRITGAPTENAFHCLHCTNEVRLALRNIKSTPPSVPFTKGKIHRVTLSAVGFRHEKLKILPGHRPQGFETGLLVHQCLPPFLQPKRKPGHHYKNRATTGAKLEAAVSNGRNVLLSPHHVCKPQHNPAKAAIPNTTLTHQGDFNRISLNDSLRRFMF